MKNHLTTAQFAAELGLQPDSLRRRVQFDGSYYGVQPIKLPNGQLRWPADALEALKTGGQK